MSASVASKNLYELLGNDPPEDDVPKKAPRVVVKTTNTTKKQDEKPQTATGGFRGGRGNRFSGNEGAFRDRDAGRDSNRSRNTEPSGAPTRGRGRGGRGGRREFDRHNTTGRDEHEKQVNHGWGAPEGNSEWQDELAGAALAAKDAEGANPADPNAAAPEVDAEAAAAEEEGPKTKTYDEYLAELAQRQAELGPRSDVRKPNEGTQDKKWANAKPFTKQEGEYFAGEAKDKSRNRERKQKQVVDIDMRFTEPSRGERGGRGGRGGRGDRGGRGGRGGDRGAPRAERGERGGRGGRAAAPVNLADDSAFPSLGQ
ncbi:hypothetical protein EX30DRAFT_373242 [Ascodesmis nigricans]|uniref:Hyaluronan/mRNA-binding protein domain-containing protein n=1 Tax=Ascodesmis nigricans TaxID=341454 RepID=A0A4S2MPU3_9PEZI|nr:hypothetical protein EX30DRAFT_373242 [Ascodesmis nigricans]